MNMNGMWIICWKILFWTNRGSSYSSLLLVYNVCELLSDKQWTAPSGGGSLPCGPPASGWLLWGRARRCCWHQWTAVTSVWTAARTCQHKMTRLMLFCLQVPLCWLQHELMLATQWANWRTCFEYHYHYIKVNGTNTNLQYYWSSVALYKPKHSV